MKNSELIDKSIENHQKQIELLMELQVTLCAEKLNEVSKQNSLHIEAVEELNQYLLGKKFKNSKTMITSLRGIAEKGKFISVVSGDNVRLRGDLPAQIIAICEDL